MSSKNAKKVTTKKDNFIEDDGDKRIIIFVAVAILIVIGIVIALLSGCEKEEQVPNKPSENNNPQTDVVVPNDEEEKEEQTVEKEKTSIVKKTSTKTSSNNKKDEKEEEKEEEVVRYKVTYVYNIVYDENDGLIDYEMDSAKVDEGSKIPTTTWCPSGYTNCVYYTEFDKGVYSNEFDLNTKVYEDIVIYIKGEVINYTIEYKEENPKIPGTFIDADVSETQPKTYNANDGYVPLEDPQTLANGDIFKGWYLYYDNGEYYVYAPELNINITSFAKDGVITLYAASSKEVSIKYYNNAGENLDTITQRDSEFIILENSNHNYCDNSQLLGWSLYNDNTINYKKGETTYLTEDLELYAVCGTKVVKYNSDVDGDEISDTHEVEKGYDEENFELPTEEEITEELGFTPPTYYVPVQTPTESSKVVVDKDTNTEIILENEVPLYEVEQKAGKDYTPVVGDNVEEKEKVFDGWEIQDGDTTTQEEKVDEETYEPQDGDTLTATWKEQEEIEEETTEETEQTNSETSETLENTSEETSETTNENLENEVEQPSEEPIENTENLDNLSI
ncbi:MAG: hypothetical protein IJB83_06265 [Bacilli bacterium]|nr:hypothetical protein [Bacilli bacterium]